jgi:redox-sensitive bicupin YhaK (pirin superfamily)
MAGHRRAVGSHLRLGHLQVALRLLAAKLDAGGSVTHTFKFGNDWLQVARGSVAGGTLKAGNGLQLEGESAITVSSETGAEFLLFDLA